MTSQGMEAQMATKFDFLDTKDEDAEEWQKLCPLGEFRVVPSGSLPEVIPQSLRDKCVDSLVMGSGSNDGYAYYVVNLLRKDEKDRAVDQQPFCLWFSGSQVAPSGCLVQHGDWEDRTIDVPERFFDDVRKTGVAPYVGLLQIPTSQSGSITALSASTHEKAFDRVVRRVKLANGDEG